MEEFNVLDPEVKSQDNYDEPFNEKKKERKKRTVKAKKFNRQSDGTMSEVKKKRKYTKKQAQKEPISTDVVASEWATNFDLSKLPFFHKRMIFFFLNEWARTKIEDTILPTGDKILENRFVEIFYKSTGITVNF